MAGNTFLQRYAILRKLAQSVLSSNKKTLGSDEISNWVESKKEHRKAVKANIESMFKNNESQKKDITSLLYSLLTTTDFPELGIQKTIKTFGISKKEYDANGIKLLLQKLNWAPVQNELVVKLIAKAFLEHKQKEAAKFVIKCWDELTST